EYEVDHIVAHKFDKRSRRPLYLLRWKGYDPLHDSWASERDLRNAPALLRDYKKAAGL
ncbi:hypothetical protein PLICRDRAFT_120218, partial [Plicaturopsis crispa FD-325 SS-3]